MRYRLVRNIPYEKYLLGRSEPFAPRYDVEEVDEARIPIRAHGTALKADAAKALKAKLEQAAATRPPPALLL